MNVEVAIQTYLLLAVSLAISTYLTILIPAYKLAEEIVGKTLSEKISSVAWLIAATVAAPAILLLILLGKSQKLTDKLAVMMAERTGNV